MTDRGSLADALRRGMAGDVRTCEPMSRHTTYRVGGPADVLACCDTVRELTHARDVCREAGIPYVVLGRGSNVLVSDEGYRGVVITLGSEFKGHSWEGTGNHLQAGAACNLAVLVQEAFARGCSGLEFAVGIPGTFGGALAMNAGTRDGWIGEVVESVTLLTLDGGLVRLRGTEVGWSYRHSDLPQRGIIVEGVLAMTPSEPAEIRAVMEEGLARRKRTQPVGARCAGSVFVNPEGDSAGRLIEATGLKGVRIGGARISDVHANFIVNEGRATARDVLALMRLAQQTVLERYAIPLEPEIRLLGEFEGLA